MTPEQQQDMLNRLTKLETEKGTDAVMFSGIQKILSDIQGKLDKAIVYNEKHDNLSRTVDELRKDYDLKKQQIDLGMGWLKGAFAVGGVTVAIISALMLFIAKDGLNSIKEQEGRINDIQHRTDTLETRLNVGNPKSP
jgi:hypothetical protein